MVGVIVADMGRIALLGCVLLGACVLPRPISKDPAGDLAGPTATLWQPVGRSAEGRAIEACEVGSGARKVLWVGGIHGTEREGSVATERLPAAFANTRTLGDHVTLTLVRDLNPDGSAANNRHNARDVDLNRNFPATNFVPHRRRGRAPLDQPESRVLHDLIVRGRPDLVLICHSTERGYINFDGPARRYAEVFSRASGYPVVESNTLHSTPGSLGSWVGLDLGIPILTLEYRRGTPPERAWDETRDAILAVLGSWSSDP